MKKSFWQRGGTWVLLQWVLMGGALVAGPLWRDDWEGNVSRWVAAVLWVAGSVFGIAGAVQLGRHRTIFPEPMPGSRLVRHGIYGLVRHPLYTSVISLSLAWALGWRSVPTLILALATVVFLDAKARHEEGRLRQVFPDYDDYARRVKRLVPFLY
jgi:protein-S-isoprenylcysteine O-methyltransferase Ste14